MKTICIYHKIDLDGWMSAAIVSRWYNQLNEKVSPVISLTHEDVVDRYSPFITRNYIAFLGYNYGDKLPDLSRYDEIIICDISFTPEYMKSISFDKKVTWIDHHASAIDALMEYDNHFASILPGLRDINFAACELAWMYFFPNTVIPEIVRLLGRYDCFGHKMSNKELEQLKQLELINPLHRTDKEFRQLMKLKAKHIDYKKVLTFQYGARSVIFNKEDAYDCLTKFITKEIVKYDYASQLTIEDIIMDKGHIIYDYLCKEAIAIYNTKTDIYFTNSDYTKNFKFALINRERFNPVNFNIDYHKDGYDGCACFHYSNGKFNFSIYNDNGKVDCSIIAKQFGGGGHKGASGFRLDVYNFTKLLKL